MLGGRKRRWERVFWGCIGLMLIASLSWCESREVQVGLFRMVFRLTGGRTFTYDLSPGCVVHLIPEVDFTRQYCEQLGAAAERSPDDYLVARYCRPYARGFPPPEAWRGHPMLQWAAVEITSQLMEGADDGPASATRPARIPAKRIEEALAIVRLAQAAAPENGAIYLAEALLLFEAGEDGAALNALRQAAEKHQWALQSREVFFRARELLINRGLPRFDATFEANRFAEGRFGYLTHEVAKHLDRLLAQAVSNREDGNVTDLLLLWARLRRARTVCPDRFLWFPALDIHQEESLAAMAGQRSWAIWC